MNSAPSQTLPSLIYGESRASGDASPLLFILLVEPLIGLLRERTSGVELAPGTRLRSLHFADDGSLLASNLNDLQAMLDVCSAWALDMGMAFNASKSVLLVLKGPRQTPTRPMLLMGEPIAWQQEARYLCCFSLWDVVFVLVLLC